MSKLSLLVAALWVACAPVQQERLPVPTSRNMVTTASSSSSSSSSSSVPSEDQHSLRVSYRLEGPPEIQGVLGTYCVEKKESENISSVSKMHLDQFLMNGAIHLIEGKYDTPFSRLAGFHVGRMVVPSSPKLMENANGEERYCGQAFLNYVDFMRLKAPLN